MSENKPRIFYVWPKRKGEFFGSILAVEDFESAINPECKQNSFLAIEHSAYLAEKEKNEKLGSELAQAKEENVKLKNTIGQWQIKNDALKWDIVSANLKKLEEALNVLSSYLKTWESRKSLSKDPITKYQINEALKKCDEILEGK